MSQKSVIKTLRMPLSLFEEFEKEASLNGLSINFTIINALRDYLSIRYLNSYLQIIGLPRVILNSFLKNCNESSIDTSLKEIDFHLPDLLKYFAFFEKDAKVLPLLHNLSYNLNWFTLNFVNVSKNYYFIMLQHDLDPKWNIFIKFFLSKFDEIELDSEKYSNKVFIKVKKGYRYGSHSYP